MYIMKHASLIVLFALLQGCIVGPDQEGTPTWYEKILPFNFTERRSTFSGEDWAGYNRDRRYGIAGPRSHYGIHPRHDIKTWETTRFKDPITGDYRFYRSYNEYLRDMQPKP